MLLNGSWPLLEASWSDLRAPNAFDTAQDGLKMECPAKGAGPVLVDFSLLRPESEALCCTPMPPEVGGGLREAEDTGVSRWMCVFGGLSEKVSLGGYPPKGGVGGG